MKYLKASFTVFFLFLISATSLSAQDKNSVQGDFEALQALYNATQGQGVPTLNSVNELPSDPRDAEYPYMYMIDGEIYYLEYARHNEFVDGYSDGWKNAGSPWKHKSGWVNMTSETMGNAVGITTDGNGRVIRVDMQKVTTELVNGVYLTRGNGLVGELPEEIGNLTRLKYWNVKQNFLYGEIPSSIGNWTDVERLSFAGESWDMQLDEENRKQWHESDHRKGYETITIVDGLSVGSGRLADISKKIMATNRFRTDVPSDIDGFQNLELIELRHQFLTGILPAWSELPTIRGILLDNSRDVGAESISGSIPESWGNLTTTVVFQILNQHTNPRFTGELPRSLNNWTQLANFDVSHNNFTGPILEFPLSRDKRYIRFIDNNFTGGFPTGYFNGDNALMTKWQIGKNELTGEIPKQTNEPNSPIKSPTYPRASKYYGIDSPGIGDNNFTGPLPDWFQRMGGIQTLYIANMNFSGPFPDKLMEQNSLKSLYINGNNFSGVLPDKNWGDRRIGWLKVDGNNFEGTIPERWRSLILTDSDEFPWSSVINEFPNFALERFTGTSVLLDWTDQAEPNAMAYEVILLDKDAKIAYKNEYVNGTTLTISGLSLAEYRPIITPVSWTNPNMFTGTGATLTWDAISGAAGYQVEIYDRNGNLVLRESWMSEETLAVSGLESGTYTWRVRGMDYVAGMGAVNFSDNYLSGAIPDFFSEISIGAFTLNGNRYTFRDIGPVYQSFLNANFNSFEIGNQKPFGEIKNRTMPSGETVVFDLSEFDYQGNSYQWIKDGTPIEGETNSVLTISNLSSENEGSYVLEVRNSDMAELGTHRSQPINFRIGEDDGKNSTEGGNSSGSEDDGGNEPDQGTQFPNAPVQQYPIDNSENNSLSPTFTWSDAGADYYILHADRSNPSGMVIEVVVEDTSFTPTEILGSESTHYWRVQGVKNGEPGEWSPVWSFTTDQADIPQMADLVSPAYRADSVSTDLLLKWTAVEADLYKVRLRSSESSEWLMTRETEFNEYLLTDLLEKEVSYIWQVKTVSGGIDGAWSPMWEFSTGIYETFVQSPSLIAPVHKAEYKTLSPVFEWENINADQYVLTIERVDSLSAKGKGMYSSETESVIVKEITEAKYSAEETLTPGATYTWRVKAIIGGVEGDWSETWEFKTPNDQSVSADIDERPVITTLAQNYPNPFNPTTQIEFSLSETQNVSMKVYNMAGREVANIVSDVLNAGRHSITFNASHLSSGIYFYRLVTNSESFTKKMTLLK